MGRSNQQRRAEKKRKAGRRHARREASGFGEALAGYTIEIIAIDGAEGAARRDREGVDGAVGNLARLAATVGRQAVTRTLGGLFSSMLAAAWAGGWQPAEVVRQVRRSRRDAHASLVVAALAAPDCWGEAGGATMPPVWSEQLDRLGVAPARSGTGDWLASALDTAGMPLVDGLQATLEVLGELMHLPEIETLIPPPTEWRDVARMGTWVETDNPVLTKVRALLAKAESTRFPAEAEALTVKAQELMARHSIDEVLARASSSEREAPETRRLAVDDPYADAKSLLLQAVMSANRARCVWYEGYAMMAVIGYRADLDAIEVLFTSLLVQADKAMLDKGSVTDRSGRSRTRSFRRSFLTAYASRIRERLEMAALEVQREAESDMARTLVPVLAAADQELDDALAAAFPHLRQMRGPVVTNEAGWRAGRIAAELATLGPQQGMLDGMTAAG